MSLNIDLLDRTLAHIEAHPEHWDQTVWRCDSAMCFAGWTAELAGGKWLLPEGDAHADYLAPEPGDDPDETGGCCQHLDSGIDSGIAAENRARRLLGLTEKQSARLFDGSNTLDDLRRIVAELKAGAQ